MSKFIILVSMAVWTIICWHWYTCPIKGFCAEKTEARENVSPVVTPEIKTTKLPMPNKDADKKSLPTIKQEEKTPEDSVIPKAAVQKECQAYMTQHVGLSRKNNIDAVKKLEQFLNDFEGTSLSVDGVYSVGDERAVKAFQEKYKTDILVPWELSEPTGNVFTTTVKKINELYCQEK